MPAPVHRDEVRKVLVGVVTLVVAVIVGVIGAIVQGGGALPGRPYTYVSAAMGDVGILNPGKDVKQNGIEIGTVSAIEYEDDHAVVTLRLNGERKVYRNATAQVGNTSALGRKYVAFDPGTPAAGPLGHRTIPLSRTRGSQALEDAFAALDAKTRKALGASLRELAGGVAGHGGDLRSVLRSSPDMLADLGTVSSAATGPGADLPGMLRSANKLVGRFIGREAQLSGLLRNMQSTLSAVNVDNGAPLSATMSELPPTLRSAKQALDRLHEPVRDVKAALVDLEHGGKALGTATPDLRGLLREAVGPLAKVPSVSDQAVPAVDELTHTIADARPLVPRLAVTLGSADEFLHGLAPYATDTGRFFSQHDLLSGKIAPYQNYFSAKVTAPGLYSVAGLPDPVVGSEPYPEPGGGAWRDSPNSGGIR